LRWRITMPLTALPRIASMPFAFLFWRRTALAGRPFPQCGKGVVSRFDAAQIKPGFPCADFPVNACCLVVFHKPVAAHLLRGFVPRL
jgi:hypothetical protein